MMKKLFYLLLGSLLILSGCARLPKDYDKKESYAFTNTKNTTIGKTIQKLEEKENSKSGVYILNTGVDAFVARAALAERAEKSIDVQYYLYHDDLIGKLFTYELMKAADRGVRVRVLIDDMGMGDSAKDKFAAILDNYPNIEVRLFNPFTRTSSRISQLMTNEHPITRRMHNKSFTVDNQMTILGGRNIGDEYFDADPVVDFKDMDIVGVGEIAKEVSKSFDKYWNNELSYPASILVRKKVEQEDIDEFKEKLYKFVEEQENSVYLEALKNSNLAEKIKNDAVVYHWGKAHVLYDDPGKIMKSRSDHEYNLAPQLRPYFNAIQKELIIYSPYFVPGKIGVEYLTDLAKKGVRVRILTNSLASNDVGIVHSGYMKYRKDLLRGGIELYEMNKELNKEQKENKKWIGSSKASLHAKSFVLDRERVFVGSLNLDPRSVIHNTEIGVIIDNKELGEKMAEDFDKKIDKIAFRLELVDGEIVWHGIVDGEEKTFTKDPYTSFWQRMGVGAMRILPIESQL